MRISARCDYACKALLALSLHWPNDAPLQIQQISQDQKIPMRYLVQILIQLKRQGLVSSSRGKDGGYNLAKPPQDISLGEVIRNISGAFLPLSNSAVKHKSVFTSVWKSVEDSMSKILDKITFEDICRKSKDMETMLIYQI